MGLKDVAKNLAKKISVNSDTFEKGAKGFDKFYGSILEEVEWGDADGILEKVLGVRMTKPAVMVGTTLMAGYVVGNGMLGENHKGKMGDIEGSQLANTVNHTTSHTLNHMSDDLQKRPDLSYRFGTENINNSQSGVDPNIVFAMHQLRRGE